VVSDENLTLSEISAKHQPICTFYQKIYINIDILIVRGMLTFRFGRALLFNRMHPFVVVYLFTKTFA